MKEQADRISRKTAQSSLVISSFLALQIVLQLADVDDVDDAEDVQSKSKLDGRCDRTWDVAEFHVFCCQEKKEFDAYLAIQMSALSGIERVGVYGVEKLEPVRPASKVLTLCAANPLARVILAHRMASYSMRRPKPRFALGRSAPWTV